MVTGSFMDYPMPRAGLPTDFTIGGSRVPSPNNPLGAKGAGKAGTTGALRPADVTH